MWAVKSLKIFTLMGSFLSVAYKILDEKLQKGYVSWHWRVLWSLKKNWFLVLKMTQGTWWILMWTVASLRIWTLMCYFCWRDIIFEPKKYKGIMCHKTGKWWEELNCALKNDMRNLVNFDPTLESLTICTLMGSFWPMYMFELKKTQRNDASLYWRSIQTLIEKWLAVS